MLLIDYYANAWCGTNKELLDHIIENSIRNTLNRITYQTKHDSTESNIQSDEGASLLYVTQQSTTISKREILLQLPLFVVFLSTLSLNVVLYQRFYCAGIMANYCVYRLTHS
jgi:hypothetical protein